MITTEAPTSTEIILTTEPPTSTKIILTTEAPRSAAVILTTEAPRSAAVILTTEAPRSAEVILTTEAPRSAAVILTTERPTSTEIILTTEAPTSTEIILTTEPPTSTEIILTTEPPTSTEIILTTERPTSTEIILTTEAPTSTEIILTTEPPTSTEIILTTEPPTSTEIILTTEPPTSTEIILTTEPPTSTEIILTTEAPTSTEIILTTEPPTSTEIILTTEPPTSAEVILTTEPPTSAEVILTTEPPTSTEFIFTTEPLTSVEVISKNIAEVILTTEAALPTSTTRTTYNPENEVEEVKDLMTDVIKFEPVTNEINASINEVKVWKPNFNGATISKEAADAKSNEYMNNRTNLNLVGYFNYNGFLDVGVDKSRQKSNSRNSDVVVDEEAMVETVKSFQRFNGFPETGALTESQFKELSLPGCGNRDISLKGALETFKCHEGENLKSRNICKIEGGRVLLGICGLYPSAMNLEEDKHFIWNKDYYFEADVEFDTTSKKLSHIGIAFNYLENQADYIMIANEADLKRLSFRSGKFDDGLRKERVNIDYFEKYENDLEKTMLGLFKIRLTVKYKKASISINGKRIFYFDTSMPLKSSVFVFTLSGRNYKTHNVNIFTSRVCRRNIDKDTKEKRSKRYALSNYRWHTDDDVLTYSFANYSSNLGKLRVIFLSL